MEFPITNEFADSLAEEWFAAWNAHDVERLLTHYSDNVVFVSPFAVEFAGDASGTVRGKQSLREYWTSALASLPDLHFDPPLAVVAGISSVSFVYTSVRNLRAVETMVFNPDGLISQAYCHFRSQ